jgi:hypothetical protein
MRRLIVAAVLVVVVGAACSDADPAAAPSGSEPATTAPATTRPSATISTPSAAPPSTTTTAPPPTTIATTTTTESPYARPDWLGTRLLPLRPDEHGEVQPTPDELVDRRLETIDLLPPPAGDTFTSTLGPVPDDVLARSTWTDECPVTVDELAYITVSHWGFDQEFHTGEMIVNSRYAADVIDVFGALHEARFPIEQMRVIRQDEVDAHPTGDWNDTTSFVCRPAVGSSQWSNHAFGLAIDINPFHNPYLRGDLVLPELASVYVDREDVRAGMIVAGDVVVEAFADMGWLWGGNWTSLKDWMHFSWNGS